MKRLLIIGASILQLPAILKAKEMGLYVGVVDYNEKAVGITYADEYFNVSTVDEVGIYEVAKKFKADGIMTLATDMPMRSLAYAAEKLDLVGISYETAIKATDKGEMIKAFSNAGVEHPWFVVLDNTKDIEHIKERISYPCISKPIDNAGSRGVIIINSESELYNAIEYSSINGRSGRIIIEEFLEGHEVSVEILVVNSVIHVLQVTDKLTTGAPHFVEMGHSQPAMVDKKSKYQIEDLSRRAVRAIGIENGPAHVEIMLTSKGPKMIELGARMGGDCITTHLIPLSTGIDMVKATIEIALGLKPTLASNLNRASAIRFIEEHSGKIIKISKVEEAQEIEGVKEISFMKNVGDYVNTVGNSMDRVGYVISQGEDVFKAVEACDKACKCLEIVVD